MEYVKLSSQSRHMKYGCTLHDMSSCRFNDSMKKIERLREKAIRKHKNATQNLKDQKRFLDMEKHFRTQKNIHKSTPIQNDETHANSLYSLMKIGNKKQVSDLNDHVKLKKHTPCFASDKSLKSGTPNVLEPKEPAIVQFDHLCRKEVSLDNLCQKKAPREISKKTTDGSLPCLVSTNVTPLGEFIGGTASRTQFYEGTCDPDDDINANEQPSVEHRPVAEFKHDMSPERDEASKKVIGDLMDRQYRRDQHDATGATRSSEHSGKRKKQSIRHKSKHAQPSAEDNRQNSVTKFHVRLGTADSLLADMHLAKKNPGITSSVLIQVKEKEKAYIENKLLHFNNATDKMCHENNSGERNQSQPQMQPRSAISPTSDIFGPTAVNMLGQAYTDQHSRALSIPGPPQQKSSSPIAFNHLDLHLREKASKSVMKDLIRRSSKKENNQIERMYKREEHLRRREENIRKRDEEHMIQLRKRCLGLKIKDDSGSRDISWEKDSKTDCLKRKLSNIQQQKTEKFLASIRTSEQYLDLVEENIENGLTPEIKLKILREFMTTKRWQITERETMLKLKKLIDHWMRVQKLIRDAGRTETLAWTDDDEKEFFKRVICQLKERRRQLEHDPWVVLQTAYLRLDRETIKMLEKLCHEAGNDPGIHMHTKNIDVFSKNIFRDSNPTSSSSKEKTVVPDKNRKSLVMRRSVSCDSTVKKGRLIRRLSSKLVIPTWRTLVKKL